MVFGCRKGCVDKTFPSTKARDDHERMSHGSTSCDKCKITFPNYNSFKDHLRLHNNGDRHFLLASVAAIPVAIKDFSDRKVSDEFKAKFAGVMTFNDQDLSYGNYVLRQHPEFPIAASGWEFLQQPDIAGMSKSYDGQMSAKISFIRDVHYDFAKQSHPIDFEGTVYQFSHVVPSGNYLKDRTSRIRTYVMPNCVASTAAVNRQVGTFEEEGRNLAVNNWSVIVITIIFLPPLDQLKYLKDSKTPVPDRVGKIFLYRNLEGLHLRGRRSISNYEQENGDENVNDTLYDPFKLLVEAGISSDLNKQIIRTINGTQNSAYVEGLDCQTILPPFKPFFDLFIGKEMETEVSSTRTRAHHKTLEKRKQNNSSSKEEPKPKKAPQPSSSSSTSSTSKTTPGPLKDAFELLMMKKKN